MTLFCFVVGGLVVSLFASLLGPHAVLFFIYCISFMYPLLSDIMGENEKRKVLFSRSLQFYLYQKKNTEQKKIMKNLTIEEYVVSCGNRRECH